MDHEFIMMINVRNFQKKTNASQITQMLRIYINYIFRNRITITKITITNILKITAIIGVGVNGVIFRSYIIQLFFIPFYVIFENAHFQGDSGPK